RTPQPRSQLPRFSRRSRFVALIAAVVMVAAVLAGILLLATTSGSGGKRAHGAGESIFQDDQLLLYSGGPTVAKTLDTLRGLGVDRIRIIVLWSTIAPDAGSRREPRGFRATDPGAYPAASWRPYDRVVRLAGARRIALG